MVLWIVMQFGESMSEEWFPIERIKMYCRFLVLYGEVCVCSIMLFSWEEYQVHQTIHFIIFQLLAFLSLSSHLKVNTGNRNEMFIINIETMLTDPGAVPKGMLTEDTLERIQAMSTEVGRPPLPPPLWIWNCRWYTSVRSVAVSNQNVLIIVQSVRGRLLHKMIIW